MNTAMNTNSGAPVAQDLTEFYILTALRALNDLNRQGFTLVDGSDLVSFDQARFDLEVIMGKLRNRREVSK